MNEAPIDAAAQELAWIRRVQADGDHAAFACLLRRHQGAVRAVLRRLTRGDAALLSLPRALPSLALLSLLCWWSWLLSREA